jgi:hypothetical protein
LDALRERLRATRWPERETVQDDSQGVRLAELQALCAHWADGYDWRVAEARLNAVPQFRTTIDGLGIHFLRAHRPRAGGTGRNRAKRRARLGLLDPAAHAAADDRLLAGRLAGRPGRLHRLPP